MDIDIEEKQLNAIKIACAKDDVKLFTDNIPSNLSVLNYNLICSFICDNNSIKILNYIKKTFVSDDEIRTMIEVICKKGSFELVNIYFDGINVNMKLNNKNSALLIALNKKMEVKFFSNGNYVTEHDNKNKVIKFLIERGADINIQNNDGYTPLTYASDNDMIDIVRLLLEKKVDVNVKDLCGFNAFMVACCKGKIDIIRVFLEHLNKYPDSFDIYDVDQRGRTGLALACSFGHEDVAKMIISYSNTIDYTAMFEACYRDSCDIVEFMINKGYDINKQDVHNNTLFITACRENSKNIVKLLIKKGVNLNAQNEDGNTGFIMACIYDKTDVIRILCGDDGNEEKGEEKGEEKMEDGNDEKRKNININLNMKNNCGDTGFIIACKYARHQTINIIKKYVDTNMKNNFGESGFMILCRNNLTKIISDVITYVDINTQDTNGDTPFIISCRFGYAELIDILLKYNVKVNIANNNGDTGFILVCKHGCEPLIRVLVPNVDLNIKNNDGDTGFIWVCYNGLHDMVSLLKSNGADVNIKNKYGYDGYKWLNINSPEKMDEEE